MSPKFIYFPTPSGGIEFLGSDTADFGNTTNVPSPSSDTLAIPSDTELIVFLLMDYHREGAGSFVPDDYVITLNGTDATRLSDTYSGSVDFRPVAHIHYLSSPTTGASVNVDYVRDIPAAGSSGTVSLAALCLKGVTSNPTSWDYIVTGGNDLNAISHSHTGIPSGSLILAQATCRRPGNFGGAAGITIAGMNDGITDDTPDSTSTSALGTGSKCFNLFTDGSFTLNPANGTTDRSCLSSVVVTP